MTTTTDTRPPGSTVQARVAYAAIAGAWVAAACLGWPLASLTARVLVSAGFGALAVHAIRRRTRVRNVALGTVLASPALFAFSLFDNLARADAGLKVQLISGRQLAVLIATVIACLALAWHDDRRMQEDDLPTARVRRR